MAATPDNPNNPTFPNSPAPTPELRPAQTDRRYYWFLIIYLVLLSALGSFVNDMYTPSLPQIARDFHSSPSQSQLSLTMGMIGLAIGQLLLGPISDRYGRKPVLVISMLVFIAGAVISVFSKSMIFFLMCRLVQGMGASGGYFLARTIPADIFHGRELARFMAIIGAVNGLAPASAPVLGGVIADYISWKAVFIFLAAFTVLILAFIGKLKESLYPQDRSKLPWYRTLPGYMVLLRNKAFVTHICLKGCSLGLLFTYISAAPFILEDHYGFSQTMYGVIIGLNSIAVALGSMLSLRFHPFKKAVPVAALILVPAVGYVVGAVVAPLAGIGDVMHSTAIVFLVLLALVLVCSFFTYRLKPDLDS